MSEIGEEIVIHCSLRTLIEFIGDCRVNIRLEALISLRLKISFLLKIIEE